MNHSEFITALTKKSISLSERQLNQLDQYAHFLIGQNKVMNLTAITEEADIYEKHFYDSLLISPLIQGPCQLADVGTGAGFPGVVLAIARPDIEVVLIEPLQKRCRFLSQLIELLELKNCSVKNKRAEEAIQERETFDYVCARAVSNLSILLELCIPLVKVQGHFIAMKGSKGLLELEQAQTALKKLGCRVEKTHIETLYSHDDQRINLVIEKVSTTPKQYPRGYAQIKKKPL